jgi:adenylate cyclase
MTTNRQLVAVLAADIAGYTSLMELDEDATHDRIKYIHSSIVIPSIDRHRGRIVKFTGDGFLAVFGDAVEATACAVAIQEAIAEATGEPSMPVITYRMGVNLTEAIIEPEDVYGDGVNLAARLQSTAEPGGIIISAAAAEKVRPFAAFNLVDIGELRLKHMRRTVPAFSVRTKGRLAAQVAPVDPLPEDRPSIAVLPFVTEPTDTAGKWFAEGIIEGIIHILAGIENLFVISRGTSLAYAGREVDPRVVGQDLGVRYVLGGRVRRDGERLRIFTELSDATSGSTMRADRRDGTVGDLFEMQDRIAAEVVGAIAPAVHASELARAMRKPPDSVTAYDLLLQALDVLYQLRRDTFDRARGLLQQAMASDPRYAPAFSHAATWHMFRIGQGWSPNVEQDAQEAERCAAAALDRDSSDAVALAIHGQMLSFIRRDYAAAMSFLDRAIAAGPSCPMAWTLSSTTSGWMANGERAVQHATRALQLSPLDPFGFFAEHMLSQGYYVSGDFEQAISWGRRAAARNGMLVSNLRTLAVSLVAAGDVKGASAIARRILAADPDFRISQFAARSPLTREVLDSFVPRLRAAGLPE